MFDRDFWGYGPNCEYNKKSQIFTFFAKVLFMDKIGYDYYLIKGSNCNFFTANNKNKMNGSVTFRCNFNWIIRSIDIASFLHNITWTVYVFSVLKSPSLEVNVKTFFTATINCFFIFRIHWLLQNIGGILANTLYTRI